MNEKKEIQIDLRFYKGEDRYSDGDIEDEILEIVKTQDDYTGLLASDDRWPILYHFSPKRRDLLEWYPFDSNATGLEIGAGCGALTGLLCEKLSEVTVVELSKRRAEIVAHRHRRNKNLKIIAGNLNDIEMEHTFDYVTLIGVLEYSGKYTDSANPYLDFLIKIKSYLRDNGKLLIAIENKYGLKYWNGAREDHTGRLFDGLENYMHSSQEGISTFSKTELAHLLTDAGFESCQFYYPLPDYKLPVHVYSDDLLPAPGVVSNLIENYDQERLLLFNEENVMHGLIENGQFGFFANSFLVECTKRGASE